MGDTASASNGGSAFGDFANATCPGCASNVSSSTAIGNTASATTVNSVAVGQSANVQAVNGTAIGANAVVVASATNAVAIGQGSVASAPNTVSVGAAGSERRITNVAAGIAPTDAVNMSQLASVATGVSTGLQSQINSLQGQINTNLVQANAGTALAMAASGLRYDDRPGKLSASGGFGNYKGLTGLAIGLGYAYDNRLRFNVSVSGVPNQSDYGVTGGASWTLN
jgi:trimeric autotransporter adhesin